MQTADIARKRRLRAFQGNNRTGGLLPEPTFFAPLRTSLFPARAAGSPTPTFSRATTAYVQDHEGVLRCVLANEARFWGARRVHNLVSGGSGAFNATWNYLNGASRTQVTGVDGDQWAKVSCDGVTSDPQVAATPITTPSAVALAGRTFTFSFWVYSDAAQLQGNGNDDLRAFIYDNSLFSVNSITFRVTTTPQKVVGTFTFPVGTTSTSLTPLRVDPFDGVLTPSAGRYIYIKWAMCEEVTGASVTTPSQYVAAGIDTGAGVTGVQYLDTARLHTQNKLFNSNPSVLSFNPNAVTLTPAAGADPLGGSLAFRLANSVSSVWNFSLTSGPQEAIGAKVRQSFFVKYESGGANFACYFGDSTSAGGGSTSFTWAGGVLTYAGGLPVTIEPAGNGWYRVSAAYVASTAISSGNFTISPTSGAFSMLFFGLQWCGGSESFTNAYVPTTAGAVGPTDTGVTAPLALTPFYTYDPAGTQLVAATAAIRDLSDASWTKTSMTTARTSAGVDGVLNGATRCTATAANATAFQPALVAAATARYFSLYLRRVTGTGNVDVTQDNGTTWTNVMTGAGTGAFVRVQQIATVLNPQIGIRIVTSGDAVDVDFVQHEAAVNMPHTSSPMSATGAVRNADLLTYPIAGNMDSTIGTAYIESGIRELSNAAGYPYIGGVDAGTGEVAFAASSPGQNLSRDGTTTPTTGGGAAWVAGVLKKLVTTWGGGLRSLAITGGTPANDSAFDGSFDGTAIRVGTFGSTTGAPLGGVRNLRVYSQKMSNAQKDVMVA